MVCSYCGRELHRRGTRVPELADISGFIRETTGAAAAAAGVLKLGSWVWSMGNAGKWASGPPIKMG